MSRPKAAHRLTDAERQARRRARFAEELAQLKAAARLAQAPMSRGDPDLLQATARELKQLQQQVGELELENETLRTKLALAVLKPSRGGQPASSSSKVPTCSYCLKTKEEVMTLINNDGRVICDACVARCVEIIANRKAELAGRLALPSRPG